MQANLFVRKTEFVSPLDRLKSAFAFLIRCSCVIEVISLVCSCDNLGSEFNVLAAIIVAMIVAVRLSIFIPSILRAVIFLLYVIKTS